MDLFYRNIKKRVKKGFKHIMNKRCSAQIKKILIYTGLILWAVIVLFPFYWMILTSFKSYSSYNAEYVPKFYAADPTLQNFADAFTLVPLAKYLLNTVIFTVITTTAMLIVITLAAFAFARLSFKGLNINFVVNRVIFAQVHCEHSRKLIRQGGSARQFRISRWIHVTRIIEFTAPIANIRNLANHVNIRGAGSRAR